MVDNNNYDDIDVVVEYTDLVDSYYLFDILVVFDYVVVILFDNTFL